MSEEGIVVLAIILIIFGGCIYAVKRSYDENAYYIQQGYHRVPATGETWIK